jgi:phosphoinositide-3-kinase regulatory subunit 4
VSHFEAYYYLQNNLGFICFQGMTEEEEDKLLALKDFMMKSNKAKANIVDQSHLHDSSQKGVIDLAALGITGRQVDLVKTKQEPDDKRG